jgi:hypothetical protein
MGLTPFLTRLAALCAIKAESATLRPSQILWSQVTKLFISLRS